MASDGDGSVGVTVVDGHSKYGRAYHSSVLASSPRLPLQSVTCGRTILACVYRNTNLRLEITRHLPNDEFLKHCGHTRTNRWRSRRADGSVALRNALSWSLRLVAPKSFARRVSWSRTSVGPDVLIRSRQSAPGACLALIAMLAIIAHYCGVAVAADPLTSEEIGKLEPELCKEASPSYRELTGVLPGLAGSPTRDMAPERIALIDQLKSSGRRKLWVLGVPAAFITSRPCDGGRKNWTREGDHLRVSQIYDLDLLLLDSRAIAKTLATRAEQNAGVAVKISLQNRLTSPEKLNRIYLEKSWMFGRPGMSGSPTCHEQPSNIEGLVALKRIDPHVRGFDDCGEQQNGVFARMNADGRYDFITYCKANCRVYHDYDGWSVEYSYEFRQLENWQSIHSQIRKLLDEWTRHIDREN